METVAPTENLATFGDLLGAADCVIFPEANNVQAILGMFYYNKTQTIKSDIPKEAFEK